MIPSMKKLGITLNAESARILDSLAKSHSGNCGRALREALRMNDRLEAMLDQIERFQGHNLRRQKKRSEQGFRRGSFSRWEAVQLIPGRMKQA